MNNKSVCECLPVCAWVLENFISCKNCLSVSPLGGDNKLWKQVRVLMLEIRFSEVALLLNMRWSRVWPCSEWLRLGGIFLRISQRKEVFRVWSWTQIYNTKALDNFSLPQLSKNMVEVGRVNMWFLSLTMLPVLILGSHLPCSVPNSVIWDPLSTVFPLESANEKHQRTGEGKQLVYLSLLRFL